MEQACPVRHRKSRILYGKAFGAGGPGFKAWLAARYPNVTLLLDEEISIDGVHFFGGTMWTDFAKGNSASMNAARHMLSDFRLIKNADGSQFQPEDTITLHEIFCGKLLDWFEKPLQGPRVVITHHAPVLNPKSKHGDNPLRPAFVSLDMLDVIEKYQPNLWVYGHTHECDRQTIGKTRIISNQRGYPNKFGGFDCEGFDPNGVPGTI